MPLVRARCEPEDFPHVFEILSRAFEHRYPFIEAVFPDHHTPEGRQNGGDRLRQFAESDPHTTFLKVNDTNQSTKDQPLGPIIAMSKWNIYDDVIPAETDVDGPWWDNGRGDKDYAQELFRRYMAPRRKAIRESGGHLVSLDIMVVDPAHQRRGAGSLLMDWGMRIADILNVQAVVEATAVGRHLYEKYGFVFREQVIIEMPTPWQDLRKETYAWMTRPKPQ